MSAGRPWPANCWAASKSSHALGHLPGAGPGCGRLQGRTGPRGSRLYPHRPAVRPVRADPTSFAGEPSRASAEAPPRTSLPQRIPAGKKYPRMAVGGGRGRFPLFDFDKKKDYKETGKFLSLPREARPLHPRATNSAPWWSSHLHQGALFVARGFSGSEPENPVCPFANKKRSPHDMDTGL